MFVLATMSNADSINPILGFVYLIVFIGVLAMAYYTTRWVSKGYNRTYGTQIKVKDRLPIGLDKSFLMVQVGKMHYFLYQDRNGVKLIDRLEDFIPQESEPVAMQATFKELLEKIRIKK